MVKGIIVTHGRLGTALVETVEKIVGPVKSLVQVSNEGHSLESLTEFIVSLLKENADSQGIILMVEFKGGSCWMAAKKASARYFAGDSDSPHIENLTLVTGVNMPMLLTFVTRRDTLSEQELLDTMKTEGIQGIGVERLSGEK